MNLENQIIDIYSRDGYTKINEIPDELTFTPELIFIRDNNLKIFHLRDDSENLRDSIIQRIAQAKKIAGKTYEQYLVFNEKPKLQIKKSCHLYGIGIYYLADNNLNLLSDPKSVTGRIKRKQIPNTKIFFSSKQTIEERAKAKAHIDLQRNSHKISIFANLVEDDQRYNNNIDDLQDIINDCMDDSEYVLCILSEDYREIVDQEIRRALQLFEAEEIMVFVKNNKETKQSWKDLLNHMSENHRVKYTEYFDLYDFESKFNRRLMIIISAIHEQHGVKFP